MWTHEVKLSSRLLSIAAGSTAEETYSYDKFTSLSVSITRERKWNSYLLLLLLLQLRCTICPWPCSNLLTVIPHTRQARDCASSSRITSFVFDTFTDNNNTRRKTAGHFSATRSRLQQAFQSVQRLSTWRVDVWARKVKRGGDPIRSGTRGYLRQLLSSRCPFSAHSATSFVFG